MVSGREFTEPIAVGRGGVANAPSDLACTTGKDVGYCSRLNVRASGAMYDIRLPFKLVASLKEGVVDAFWAATVWSKSSGKVRHFLSTTAEKWGLSDSIMVLQSFEGEPVPDEKCLALQAELTARAEKPLGGREPKRAHDEPAEVSATAAPPPPPTRKAPKSASTACGSATAAVAAVDVQGIEAVARRGACEAFGDLNVPTTTEIVSAVVAGFGEVPS